MLLSHLSQFEITKDSIFYGQKYYWAKVDFENNIKWLRIDSLGKLHYIDPLNEDKIKMDFSLPSLSFFNGSMIWKKKANIFEINTEIVQHGFYKRYAYHLGYIYNYWEYELWGEERKNSETLVQFIKKMGDSTVLYKQPYLPEFANNNIFNANFKLAGTIDVNHQYSSFYTGESQPNSLNFVSSVNIEGFYQKNELVVNAHPQILGNLQYSKTYSLIYFLDSTLLNNGYVFNYRFSARDRSMVPQYAKFPDSGYFVISNISSANTSEELKLFLYQNYPNPFNPTTKIKYTIPSIINQQSSIVNLKVYDVLGNEIAILVNEEKQPGEYEVEFDGSKLSSGVYFYQLRCGSFIKINKMVLMR